MVSLMQIDKCGQLRNKGWTPVEPSPENMMIGGPTLMRRTVHEYVFVQADGETRAASDKEAQDW